MSKLGTGLLVLVCGALIGGAGCKKITEKIQEMTGAAVEKATDDRTPEEKADDEMGAKLDPYIQCINHFSPDVFRSRDRYFDWVKNPDEGPTGNGPAVPAA